MANRIHTIVILVLISMPSMATTLADLKPHTPSGKPWNEQWFYYFNDPQVGYFKISLQTFIYANDPELKERGYLHLVYTPIQGEIRTYDYLYDDVQVEAKDSTYGFRFSIPGVAEMDESSIRINTEDFSFSSDLVGPHQHYWRLNKGASPYSLLTSLPNVANRWFVFSLATPARYTFSADYAQHQGTASTYIDKGWSTSQATNYAFVMATEADQQLMLAGGSDEGFAIEMWAGQFHSTEHKMTFLPSIAGLTVTRTLSPCEGKLDIQLKSFDKEMRIHAAADTADFEDSTLPSIDVFNAEYPSAKTMNADIQVELYKFGQLKQQAHFAQGALEFGGGMHCDAQ
ncbi:hypothetical protein CHH28_09035 [Bacterioplanes sanyensis]|uniref:AttH domain-containing protein n=1 Tax=Bacterioplanes sanyensis TaxID=1249553 RepID=A0A222FJZ3_9GAMM|nr:hypothetical protein [Bacterioplanes sanyensis]ASP38814.1 hypothetical protein CHH28_09035 [Bacterioplanes sanyensis]